ncbi:MAG: hypothetical protein JXR37_26675 [Kiritimatiellae bacterium]|nr:hypothetical protein [Kiritimatiellia bacterium]
MKVLTALDGGVSQPYEIEGETVTFDLRPGQKILNVLITDPPEELRIAVRVDEKGKPFVARQGLLTGVDGLALSACPLTETAGDTYGAVLRTDGRAVRVASRYPYGRDGLEKLICDTGGGDGCRWQVRRKAHRQVATFEFGEDDGRKPMHYFIAGEDAWETAGTWTADGMVRILASGDALAESFKARCLVRIVPLASPYSATREKASYTTLEDQGLYGAATWGDAPPPPEYDLIRADVEEAIARRRLAFMLTLHSWQAQSESTGLETVKSAGHNALSAERVEWAGHVLETLIAGVPHGKTSFPQKIWHPGLARDYLLAAHDVITFRVEVTTAGQGYDGFRDTARRFLENVLRVEDWSPVYGADR